MPRLRIDDSEQESVAYLVHELGGALQRHVTQACALSGAAATPLMVLAPRWHISRFGGVFD